MFTSLASREIRKFLQKERSIHTVIDFLHTKVFENASAYTCLLFLTNNQENKNFKFKWAFNPKADLKDSQFSDIEIDELNSKKWRLAPKRHIRNINNIENIGYKLGEVADIKVGFATLKDSIFLLDKGIDVEDDIFVPAQESYEIETFIDGSIMTISDAPWPGFTPDLLSIILVVATQAKGSVLIHQKMFESRLFFVDKLIDMGAQIILCDPHRATVIGLNRRNSLRGIQMTSPDIRAGVSLLIAALSANGKSTIHNIEQIDRGYQDIDIRLNNIGADIRRIG